MISELTKWSVAVGVAVLLALIGDIKVPLAAGTEGNRVMSSTVQSAIELPVNRGAATWWR